MRASPGATAAVAAVASMVCALAGCADATGGASVDGPTWSVVAESPLSARREPAAAWVAGRFVVVGGLSNPMCADTGDCAIPPDSTLRDGAAFDPGTGTWQEIAPAPTVVFATSTAVIGEVLYILSVDVTVPEAPEALLAYDAAADQWETLPLPPGRSSQLVAAGDQLLAIPGSDEQGAMPDAVLDAATGAWRELPDDPLGPSFDRQAVWLGDRLLLAAKDLVTSPGSEEPAIVRLAELDATMTQWSSPRDTEVIGWGMVWAGGRVVFPGTGSADGGEVNNWGRSYPFGGVLNPADGSWTELGVTDEQPTGGAPGLPALAVGETVIVADGLLDPVSGAWSPLPAVPGGEVYERGVATADGLIFVWGGATTDGLVADGYLLRL